MMSERIVKRLVCERKCSCISFLIYMNDDWWYGTIPSKWSNLTMHKPQSTTIYIWRCVAKIFPINHAHLVVNHRNMYGRYLVLQLHPYLDMYIQTMQRHLPMTNSHEHISHLYNYFHLLQRYYNQILENHKGGSMNLKLLVKIIILVLLNVYSPPTFLRPWICELQLKFHYYWPYRIT